jgi:hypothetical protein
MTLHPQSFRRPWKEAPERINPGNTFAFLEAVESLAQKLIADLGTRIMALRASDGVMGFTFARYTTLRRDMSGRVCDESGCRGGELGFNS